MLMDIQFQPHTRTEQSLSLEIPSSKSSSASQLPSSSLKSSTISKAKTCLCAPTTHPGSFRCRLHRSGLGSRKLAVESEAVTKNSTAAASKNTVILKGQAKLSTQQVLPSGQA